MKKILLGGDFNASLLHEVLPLLNIDYDSVFVGWSDELYVPLKNESCYKHRVYIITPTTNIELRRDITEVASQRPEEVTLMFLSDKAAFRPNHRRIFAPLTNLIGTVRSTVKGDIRDLANVLNDIHKRYN